MFNFRELEVIERVYNNNRFLRKETNMIQFKKSMYYVKEKCGVDVLNDILGVSESERNNYRVIQCDDSYPVYVETELYKNLDRRSAINITKRLNDKVFDYECENDCNLGIHYTIRYIDKYGEEMTLYLN